VRPKKKKIATMAVARLSADEYDNGMALRILYDTLEGNEICNVWEAMLGKPSLDQARAYYEGVLTDSHVEALF
jgi:hypothetical protein